MKNKIVYRSEICFIELSSLLRLVRSQSDLDSLTCDQLKRVFYEVDDSIELLGIVRRSIRDEIIVRHISLDSADNNET